MSKPWTKIARNEHLILIYLLSMTGKRRKFQLQIIFTKSSTDWQLNNLFQNNCFAIPKDISPGIFHDSFKIIKFYKNCTRHIMWTRFVILSYGIIKQIEPNNLPWLIKQDT